MTETEPSTEGMVDYRKNSAMQQQLVHHHAGRIGELVRRLGPAQSELRIVDYGCGPGQSAIDAVVPALDAYRTQSADAPVSVCHADQPGNDWNGLFELVSGPAGYAAPGIRTVAAIGSFYNQMIADGSVDFGTCFMASHWLRHAARLDAPGSVWFGDLRGAARVELAERAQSDWTRFLQCRARELRSGGSLLVSCLGAVPQEDEINGQAASGRAVYRAIQQVAQDLVDDGLIDGSVLDRFVLGVWFMTDGEAHKPLETDPELTGVFDIEEISVVPAPHCPKDVYAEFINDPDEYARLYVGYIRGFAHSALSTQLFAPGAKSGWDGESVAAEFYRRLHELYRMNPGKYAGENWYLTVVLHKR